MKRLIQKEKVYVCRKTVEENHTEKLRQQRLLITCGSTHRHDECGGLPGTVFHTIKMVLDGNISIYSYESDEEKISDAILKPQYLPDNYRLNEEKNYGYHIRFGIWK